MDPRALLPAMLFSVILASGPALAAPTPEESVRFIAQQRKEKADFERQLLAETDPRTLAAQDFNVKQRTERIAFTRSLEGLSGDERALAMAEFNAAARQERAAFQAALPNTPKSKLEKALEEFDKKALADLQSLREGLANTDPVLRDDSIRAFQNTVRRDRAKLKSDAVQSRKRAFALQQAQKTREFFGATE
jgi:hypothetical protein